MKLHCSSYGPKHPLVDAVRIDGVLAEGLDLGLAVGVDHFPLSVRAGLEKKTWYETKENIFI